MRNYIKEKERLFKEIFNAPAFETLIGSSLGEAGQKIRRV
jgi:hypothetical protein